MSHGLNLDWLDHHGQNDEDYEDYENDGDDEDYHEDHDHDVYENYC